jgi:hypothetical protein
MPLDFDTTPAESPEVGPETPAEETPSLDQVRDAIASSIAGPASVTVDGVTVAQHDPLVATQALEKLAQQNGASLPARGLRFTKLNSPGTV